MAKHWLAVIRDNDFIIARIKVAKNKEMKILFLAHYRGKMPMSTDSEEVFNQELEELRKWLLRWDIPLKKLKLAISSLGLISRVIDLPEMSNEDLDKLMTHHIDQYFTIDVSDYLIDYRVLSKHWKNEKPMQDVLLAAFPIERMKYVLRICHKLGFEPAVVDLTADCIARFYGHLSIRNSIKSAEPLREGASVTDIAIASLYRDKVEFVLLKEGQFFLYSDMQLDIGTLVERYENREMGRKSAPAEKELSLDIVKEENEEYEEFKEIEENNQEDEQPEQPEQPKVEVDDLSLYIVAETPAEIIIADKEAELFSSMDQDIDGELQTSLIYPVELSDNQLENTIRIRAEDIDKENDVMLEQLDEKYIDMEELIGLEDNPINMVVDAEDEELPNLTTRLPQLDFSIMVPDQDEVEQSQEGDIFKQAALHIPHQDNEENEFVLEDLFVSLENLDANLAIKEIHHSVDEHVVEEHVPDRDIFDTLELHTTLIGLEELKDRGLDMDPKEELESGFSPVITTLSELLSFFAARNLGHTVSTIYLTGDYSTHPYFAKCFQENLGIHTVAGFPDGWEPLLAKGAGDAAHDWQKYACLYGLALRED